MARIIYGALAESIRGSIGGTTFQKNAYGYTIKKKPNMIHPNTSWQQAQKIVFMKAVMAWSQLTAAQRLDWEAWASTYPQYAKHNAASQLSGFAVFVRQHCHRFLAGLDVDTNPTYTVYAASVGAMALSQAAGVLYSDYTDSTGTEEYWVNIFLSYPMSACQNFIGTKTRFFRRVSNLDDGGYNITNLWTAKFGAIPAVGQQLAWRLVYYGSDNGQVLADQKGILTVTAHV